MLCRDPVSQRDSSLNAIAQPINLPMNQGTTVPGNSPWTVLSQHEVPRPLKRPACVTQTFPIGGGGGGTVGCPIGLLRGPKAGTPIKSWQPNPLQFTAIGIVASAAKTDRLKMVRIRFSFLIISAFITFICGHHGD
jgi:hypothetical protein